MRDGKIVRLRRQYEHVSRMKVVRGVNIPDERLAPEQLETRRTIESIWLRVERKMARAKKGAK